MGKLYVVKLALEEREELESITRRGQSYAWKIARAHALLKCDQEECGPGWPDEQFAKCFGMTSRCLENWRRQAVQQGPLSLFERKRPESPPTRPNSMARERRSFSGASLFACPGRPCQLDPAPAGALNQGEIRSKAQVKIR